MNESDVKVTMREICRTVVVQATGPEVWDAFTTPEGIQTFFAPAAHVEMKPGGAYELYFDPDAPEGERGSEGCLLREFEAPRFLTFSWSFPPAIPRLRHSGARALVSVHIQDLSDGTSRVVITHTGWQAGPDWEEGLRYFQRAWSLVLARLERRFAEGPIDWSDPWVPDELRA